MSEFSLNPDEYTEKELFNIFFNDDNKKPTVEELDSKANELITQASDNEDLVNFLKDAQNKLKDQITNDPSTETNDPSTKINLIKSEKVKKIIINSSQKNVNYALKNTSNVNPFVNTFFTINLPYIIQNIKEIKVDSLRIQNSFLNIITGYNDSFYLCSGDICSNKITIPQNYYTTDQSFIETINTQLGDKATCSIENNNILIKSEKYNNIKFYDTCIDSYYKLTKIFDISQEVWTSTVNPSGLNEFKSKNNLINTLPIIEDIYISLDIKNMYGNSELIEAHSILEPVKVPNYENVKYTCLDNGDRTVDASNNPSLTQAQIFSLNAILNDINNFKKLDVKKQSTTRYPIVGYIFIDTINVSKNYIHILDKNNGPEIHGNLSIDKDGCNINKLSIELLAKKEDEYFKIALNNNWKMIMKINYTELNI